MRLAPLVTALLAIAVSAVAQASGPQPPSHAQHNYSFTCPSGASGHLSYVEDLPAGNASQLSIWVNGQYLQADPKVAAALAGKAIAQARGGCEGDKTTVLLQLAAPSGSNTSGWITVLVDRAGKVVWVGA